jgi:hypothetical protein
VEGRHATLPRNEDRAIPAPKRRPDFILAVL